MTTASTVAMKEALRAALEGVGGWLDLEEAWALHEAAREACSRSESPVVAEIGSYHGRSTISLALGLRAGGGGRVWAIDPQANEPDQNEKFLESIARAGVGDLVEQIRAFSNVARDQFKGSSVDVLFIDGPHVYGAVVQDIGDWASTLKDGSVVAFNDAFWIEGVRKAIRDTVTLRHSSFRNPRWSFNTLFFDFLPAARWTARDLVRLVRVRAFLMLGGGWTEVRGKAAKRSGVMPTTDDRSFKLMMATLRAVLPKAAKG